MRLVALVSIIVGIGVFLQFGFGEMLNTLPSFYVDIHMGIGILGVILIGYLVFASIKSLMIVKVFSILTLIVGVNQIITGLNNFVGNPLAFPESIHRINAIILIILIVILGILTARVRKLH